MFYHSVDRPRFLAIAISALTGFAFQIPDIENMRTEKREDGSSGTFSFTTPLVREYISAKTDPYPATSYYAQVAGPMDLVALFAWRTTTTQDEQNGQIDPITELQKNGMPFSSLKYGDSNAATVAALGKVSSCIMIGMVDSARYVKSYESSRASFTVSGRDLTKIFEENYTSVPNASVAGQSGAPSNTENPGFFGLAQVNPSSANSGPKFITAVLDLLVAKDLSNLSTVSTAIKQTYSASAIAAYKEFGYPWRNFVRTDALDYSYQPLTGNGKNYPAYTPQLGAVWSSLLELRNPPISRMFVNEVGQLIYDDSFPAWTTSPLAATVEQTDLRHFESGFDDSSLVTFLVCQPAKAILSNKDIQAVVGEFLPGTGFVNGVAAASSASEAHVQTYGYRYGSFTSLYDLTYTDALKRQKYILQEDNNIFTASITVKGNSFYKVGRRYLVIDEPDGDGRPETTNKTWYCESVSHTMEFGNDWSCNLTLKFPMPIPGTTTL